MIVYVTAINPDQERLTDIESEMAKEWRMSGIGFDGAMEDTRAFIKGTPKGDIGDLSGDEIADMLAVPFWVGNDKYTYLEINLWYDLHMHYTRDQDDYTRLMGE